MARTGTQPHVNSARPLPRSRKAEIASRIAGKSARYLGLAAMLLRGEGIADLRFNGELRLLKSVVRAAGPTLTLLDVGANVGRWSLAAARLAPGAEIHAFEPHPEVYEELVRELAPFPNVVAHNFGLGAAAAQAELHFDPDRTSLSSVHDRQLASFGLTLGQTVMVELRTIDSTIAELNLDSVDLVKIDVEGHELETLRGARESLEHERLRVVQFEYGGTYLDAGVRLADVLALFSDRYAISRLVPWGLMPVTARDVQQERFLLSNYAAMLKA
jgi:FkbM family methyltransferase